MNDFFSIPIENFSKKIEFFFQEFEILRDLISLSLLLYPCSHFLRFFEYENVTLFDRDNVRNKVLR